ncbi:MAG: alpha/beta fold hydrolase [Rhodospirillaceae bacterium]
MTEHLIPTPRGRVFVREWRGSPAAPAIVLLHDSLGCVELWRDFPLELAAATGRRVIAYDRPGFGRSDAQAERLGLDFITTECIQSLPILSKSLGFDRFVLFGHSVGGEMAVAGAAEPGSHCHGVVSVSAQIFSEERTFEGIRAARPKLAPGSPQYERLKKYHGEKTDWVLSAWIDNWLDPEFVLDMAPYMRRVVCPVLAIHGDRDEFGSAAQARRLCESVAGPSTLHLMKDCGHVPHRERPAEVLETVRLFLG